MTHQARDRLLQVVFDPADKIFCSFCKRSQDEVKIIAGSIFAEKNYICANCFERILRIEAERIINKIGNPSVDHARAVSLRYIIDKVIDISSSNPELLPHLAGFMIGLTAKARSLGENQESDEQG